MFKVGDKAIILKSDYSSLIGRVVTIMQNDSNNKALVKVSFDDNWQGYYKPYHLLKLN